MPDTPAPSGSSVSSWRAGALVFGASGAVLVLEIVVGRLLAPYVGVSLETFTGIIGTCLAGIAVGAAVGGHLADRRDPTEFNQSLQHLRVGATVAVRRGLQPGSSSRGPCGAGC